MQYVTQSRELARLAIVKEALGSEPLYSPWLKPGVDITYVTWGRKIRAEKIEEMSRQWSIPLLRLEDGFIAYPRHPKIKKLAFSLILDQTGIYYDGSQCSDLENILNQTAEDFDEYKKERADRLIERLKQLRVSKYQHQQSVFVREDDAKPAILIIDQAKNDRSVYFAGADESSFEKMIADACQHNPDATIYVKVHPDAYISKKGSYLSGSLPSKLRVLPQNLNIWSVLEQVEKVYTVSSQLGFEAIMAGKKVHCYGNSFYSGWGLTQDLMQISRRKAKLSVSQLVYGALISYPRYFDPETLKPCEIEDVLSYLESFLKPSLGFYETIHLLGLSLWKRSFIRQFLQTNYCQNVKLAKPRSLSKQDLKKDDAVLVWGYQYPDEVKRLSDMGFTILRAEDGFIRSVGLGSDLKKPSSIYIAKNHLYYNGNEATDLEDCLNNYSFSPEVLDRAESLQRKIVTSQISKYNLSHSEPLSKPNEKHICLVIGQVPGDASLRLGGGNYNNDKDLLIRVREKFPDALIYYKPHPDVLSGNRAGCKIDPDLYDVLLINQSIQNCFQIADSVHVISSLAGFEGLIYGKTVYTYGRPFYAGWGLTVDEEKFERRIRKLQLNELIAGTLIINPIYFNWATKSISTPERIIQCLAMERSKRSVVIYGSNFLERSMRKVRYLYEDMWGRI